MKITLPKPIKFGTETYTELEFRDATIKDFKDLPLDPKVGDLMAVAGKLCNVPLPVLECSEPANMTVILGVVNSFLAPSLEIGAKPSA